MPYYVLSRGAGELYAMNMTLSEAEARRYGREGKTVPVTAVFVWTGMQQMEDFRQFLSVAKEDPDSPFRGLIQDMRAGNVDGYELPSEYLRNRLRQYRYVGFVCVDPGPGQRVVKINEFLEELTT
jgi:hypothetical protein